MAIPTAARSAAAGALLAATLLSFGPEVNGQTIPPKVPQRLQFGVGYVGNAPEAMVGGSAYAILPRAGGIGLYMDVKIDLSNPSDERGYDSSVTARQVEDVIGGDFVRSEGSWWSANVAIVRPLTPYLMAYGGGGLARRTLFRLYDVPVQEGVGEGGVVWAEDPDSEETRANLMAGVILRLSSWVSTHFGVETQPRGFTIGASLRAPPW